jgi:hypothetical protein
LAPSPTDGQSPSQFREQAQRALKTMKRLPPSAFPALPPELQKQLAARACTIPQVENEAQTKSTNAIHGEFARKGQTDWAVLCSDGQKSSIVVYWGKSAACPAELASWDDSTRLQADASGRMVYSRQITPIDRKGILAYLAAGGTAPSRASLPALDHQGIEDSFVGKASEIYFCSEGKWRLLEGAD